MQQLHQNLFLGSHDITAHAAMHPASTKSCSLFMITGNQHIKRDWNWLQSEVLCFYRNSCLKTTTEEPFLQRNCTIDVKFCWCQIEAFPLTLVSSWSISTFPLLQLKQDGKESRFSLWLRLVVCLPACIDTWTQQGLQPPDPGRRLHVWWGAAGSGYKTVN